MGYKSGIEYVDSSWNFLRGCTIKSPACTNCYAARMSARFSGPGEPYEGVVERRNGKPIWTGAIRVVEKHLHDPEKWREPRITFVNSMSDTFHESVPISVLDRAFEVMERCPKHTFLLITKRPERMRVYVESRYNGGSLPLHIWPGTTVESNEYRYRAQIVSEIPAAVRFLSCEPLLGDIDLENFIAPLTPADTGMERKRLIDWVMVGGESGPGARPMNPEWVRNIQRQCREAGVAFWFKQWGGASNKAAGALLDGKICHERPESSRMRPEEATGQ